MQLVVLKPFGWEGRTTVPGEVLDLDPEGHKARSLVKSRFLRVLGGVLPGSDNPPDVKIGSTVFVGGRDYLLTETGYQVVKEPVEPVTAEELPTIEEAAAEIERLSVQEPVPKLSPKEIILAAKERAAAVKETASVT